jgi:hypothetical protein
LISSAKKVLTFVFLFEITGDEAFSYYRNSINEFSIFTEKMLFAGNYFVEMKILIFSKSITESCKYNEFEVVKIPKMNA